MLVFCNGDAHTGGAQIANQHTIAGTDLEFKHLGDLPHPANQALAWPAQLGALLKAAVTVGPPADTVHEIAQRTAEWASELPPTAIRPGNVLVLVQWPIKSPGDHELVWRLHRQLDTKGIPHVFWHTERAFFRVRHWYEWGPAFLHQPYNREYSYRARLLKEGFSTVMPDSEYFGKDAHCVWAQHLLKYIIDNRMV